MVVCPSCSQPCPDDSYCHRCQVPLWHDVEESVPESLRLPDGRVVDLSQWQGAWPADFERPLQTHCGETPCLAYGFHSLCWRDLADMVRHRASVSLPVLAPLHIVEVGKGAVVVAESLPDAVYPLAEQPEQSLTTEQLLETTLTECRLLARVLQPLHEAGFVWLNFAPDSVEVSENQVRVRSLDVELHRRGVCPGGLRLSPQFSPREVCEFCSDRIGPATDVFHLSLYAYYRLAGLWPEGLPGEGLAACQFEIPALRIYCPHLPPGIAGILHAGLSLEAEKRPASIREFLDALAGAIEGCRRRMSSTTPLRCRAGAASAIGRSHAILGMPNQDAYLLEQQADDRLLAIVADGVTQANVGSGEQASNLAIGVLADHLRPALAHTVAPTHLQQAYLAATQAILEAVQSQAPHRDLEPTDVMSTTAVTAVIQGNELLLANVGDSRAYLIREGQAEQLTVDGDVRCFELQAGVPPEEVQLLGIDGMALYSCLGVAQLDSQGRLVPSENRCCPEVYKFGLLPEDVLVLCTDGLVEEGVFLDAPTLAKLVEQGPTEPTRLAQHLVAAAVACHRDSSIIEPAGCGDDVTCIVIRVEAACG